MKTLKENTGVLTTKTLHFSLINRRKISQQLSNTLYLHLTSPLQCYNIKIAPCNFF